MANFEDLKKNVFQQFENTEQNEILLLAVSNLILLKQPYPTNIEPTFYEPALCLILQGSKQVMAGELTYNLKAGDILVISHALPVVSTITEASESIPYMAVIMSIDLTALRSLHYETEYRDVTGGNSHSLSQFKPSQELVDAMYRLVMASQDRVESKILAANYLQGFFFDCCKIPMVALF